MRKVLLMLILAVFADAAAAGALDRPGPDADAASVQLSWRLAFGGTHAVAAPHRVALTVHRPGSSEGGRTLAESLFGVAGVQRLTLNGVNLLSRDMVLAQTGKPQPLPPPPTEGEITTLPFPNGDPPPPKKKRTAGLTGIQWLGIGVTVLALGAVVASDSGGDEEPAPIASGGGG